MAQKINKWSKLEKRTTVNPFDLGGTIAETSAGMAGAALTGLATAGPLGALAGAGSALIGGVAKGIFGSQAEKQKKEQERIQLVAQKQQIINQAPKSGAGLAQPVQPFVKAYGGYLTPQVIAKAKGGYVNPLATPMTGLVSYQGGGTHAQNPLGGIPIGKSVQGKQNSVEQGESSIKFPEGKYIFSNRLKLR